MRKITKQAQAAFVAGINWKSGNTEVKADSVPGKVLLLLHGNAIACRCGPGLVRFSLCGWPSVTTRERLQAAGISVHQSKGKQFYGQTELCPHTVYEISENGTICIFKQNTQEGVL